MRPTGRLRLQEGTRLILHEPGGYRLHRVGVLLTPWRRRELRLQRHRLGETSHLREHHRLAEGVRHSCLHRLHRWLTCRRLSARDKGEFWSSALTRTY